MKLISAKQYVCIHEAFKGYYAIAFAPTARGADEFGGSSDSISHHISKYKLKCACAQTNRKHKHSTVHHKYQVPTCQEARSHMNESVTKRTRTPIKPVKRPEPAVWLAKHGN